MQFLSRDVDIVITGFLTKHVYIFFEFVEINIVHMHHRSSGTKENGIPLVPVVWKKKNIKFGVIILALVIWKKKWKTLIKIDVVLTFDALQKKKLRSMTYLPPLL